MTLPEQTLSFSFAKIWHRTLKRISNTALAQRILNVKTGRQSVSSSPRQAGGANVRSRATQQVETNAQSIRPVKGDV